MVTENPKKEPAPAWVLHMFWFLFFTLGAGLLFFLFRWLWHHTG